MQLQTKDGKRQNRTLDIEGFVKPSGTICASVTNDRGDTYFVQIRTNGSSVCEHMVNGKRVKCDGHKYTGHCYHIREVKALAFPKFDEINVYSVSEVIATADTQVRINEAQAVRDAATDNLYDVLATMKKHTHGYGCCGHIVKSEHDGQLCGACLCK